MDDFLKSYATDKFGQQLLVQLAVHNPNEQGYVLVDGLIKLNDKLWVAHNSAMQNKIIAAFHSSLIGGHSGIQTTYHKIEKLFQWKGLKPSLEDYVN